MKLLKVLYRGWGEDWPLATLADDGRQLLFEYTPEALRQGLELSPRHLKLRAQAYGGFPAHLMGLPGLVADCLPDGWGLLLMDRLIRRQGRDPARLSPLDRLAFIGERSMGALAFEPAEPVAAVEDLQLLELARQAQQVMQGRDSEVLRELAVLGGSPHGARPKVLLHFDAEQGVMGTQPLPGSAPWMVKFQAQGEAKEVCAIECLYADIARRCGLAMPETRYFDLDAGLAAFGIARFDVEQDLRVPVHTLAGALHADFRLPALDYTTFLRATHYFTRDRREVQKAFERAVFNVVFNNRDDHSKNFSFRLGRDRCWRLSPCYDLTFSEGPRGEHQTDVCGEGREVTRAHLLRLAQEGGLDAAWAGQAIDRIAAVASELSEAAAEWPIGTATLQRVVEAVRINQARMR